jgi:hypothetical protein
LRYQISTLFLAIYYEVSPLPLPAFSGTALFLRQNAVSVLDIVMITSPSVLLIIGTTLWFGSCDRRLILMGSSFYATDGMSSRTILERWVCVITPRRIVVFHQRFKRGGNNG